MLIWYDYDVSGGTPGAALHGNPLYAGRAMGLFTRTLAALGIGGARQALDEYESMLDTKMSVMPPYVPRRHDDHFQKVVRHWRWRRSTPLRPQRNHQRARTEQHHRIGVPPQPGGLGVLHTYLTDWRISCIGREAIAQIWEVVQGEIFRTAGSSAATSDSRLVRVTTTSRCFTATATC